jgi:hypothetical protein
MMSRAGHNWIATFYWIGVTMALACFALVMAHGTVLGGVFGGRDLPHRFFAHDRDGRTSFAACFGIGIRGIWNLTQPAAVLRNDRRRCKKVQASGALCLVHGKKNKPHNCERDGRQ